MKQIIINEVMVNMKLTPDIDSSQEAIVTLTMGPFKIKGIRIRESKFENRHGDYLWVMPPSYRSGSGKFYPTFYCENKKLWEEIEDKILEEYKRNKEQMDKDKIPIIEN